MTNQIKGRKSKAKSKRRTEEFGALSRGQTFCFDPYDVDLITDPGHPLYDERVLLEPDEDFIAGLIEEGQLEPALLRKNGERQGKALIEVMDGRQRTKALRVIKDRYQEVGRSDWPRLIGVFKRADAKKAMTCMIMANQHRIADTDLVLARKMLRHSESGHSEEETRRAFRVDGARMRELLTLVQTAPAVQQALVDNKIPKATALAVAKLPEHEQTKLVDELVQSGEGRSQAGREKVKSALQANGSAVPAPRIRRTPKQVRSVVEKLAGNGRKGQEWLAGARAFAAWILGDDKALGASGRA